MENNNFETRNYYWVMHQNEWIIAQVLESGWMIPGDEVLKQTSEFDKIGSIIIYTDSVIVSFNVVPESIVVHSDNINAFCNVGVNNCCHLGNSELCCKNSINLNLNSNGRPDS